MAAEAHLSGGIVDFHLDEKAAQAALRPLPTSTREMFNEPPLCASPPHRAGWGVRWPWVELVKGQPSLQSAQGPTTQILYIQGIHLHVVPFSACV